VKNTTSGTLSLFRILLSTVYQLQAPRYFDTLVLLVLTPHGWLAFPYLSFRHHVTRTRNCTSSKIRFCSSLFI